MGSIAGLSLLLLLPPLLLLLRLHPPQPHPQVVIAVGWLNGVVTTVMALSVGTSAATLTPTVTAVGWISGAAVSVTALTAGVCAVTRMSLSKAFGCYPFVFCFWPDVPFLWWLPFSANFAAQDFL